LRQLPNLSPTTRFSSRADAYARARPSYPYEAFEWLCHGLPGTGVAADIGAGTGLSTRVLAQALGDGWQTLAVEPNAEMRKSAESHECISWIDGTAESTSIESGAVDLVLCAQAFHWFDAAKAIAEFRRILRPKGPGDGRVALVWNTHKASAPGMSEYRDIMMRHATEPPTSPSCSGWKTADLSSLEQSDSFGEIKVGVFENSQDLSRGGLLDRATSSSYIPREGEAFEKLRDDLSAYFEAFSENGQVRRSEERRVGKECRSRWSPYH